MRKTIIIILIFVVILMSGALFFIFTTAFVNDYDIKRGSLKYYVYIPSYIRNFPIIDPVSEPSFYSLYMDVHPGYNGVKYTSALDYDAAHNKLSNELGKQGLTIEETQIHDNEYVAVSSDKSIVIYIILKDLEDGTTEIKAYEVYW